MKMFRGNEYGTIEEIEYDRVTEKSAVRGSMRRLLTTDYEVIRPTRAECIEWIRGKMQGEIERAERQLAYVTKRRDDFETKEKERAA